MTNATLSLNRRSGGLWLCDDIALPPRVLGEKNCILGMSGSGKSYGLRVLCEEILEYRFPFALLDPLGANWGLKEGVDGHPGYGGRVVVFGGKHQDLPLQLGQGAEIADFILDEKLPAILDFSMVTTEMMYSIAADFLEQVYARSHSKKPFHTLFDECDHFFPQVLVKGNRGQARLNQVGKEFALRGRIRGLGMTVASQRPALVSKNVLNQMQNIITLRMTASTDLQAIRQWIGMHLPEEESKALMSTLPHLEQGQAFLTGGKGIGFQCIEIRRTRTFDSSPTPDIESAEFETREFTPEDIGGFKDRLTPTTLNGIGAREAVEFLSCWKGVFRKGEEKILETLAQKFPQAVPVKAVASAAGYDSAGGYFVGCMNRLRELGLIEEGRSKNFYQLGGKYFQNDR